MATKAHIENILRINGFEASSPEQEVRAVLEKSKYQDVDCLLKALKDPSIPSGAEICGVVKTEKPAENVLSREQHLQADSIKRLLGIDVEVNYADLEKARESRKNMSFLQLASIFGWSIACALVLLVGIMWYLKIDFFQPFA